MKRQVPSSRPAPRRGALGAVLLSAALLGMGAQGIKLVPIPPLPPGPGTPRPAPAPSPALPEIPPVPAPPAAPVELRPVSPSPASPVFRLPTDPLFPRQWDLRTIRLPEAWALARGVPVSAAQVTVAVLDTGYVSSPELTGRVVNGYDFVSDPRRSGDGNGRDADASGVGEYAYHAEVIANLIGAAHDGRGMAGINPQARVVQVRVAGTDGQIDVPDLVDGMKWAAGLSVPGIPLNPNPARLLNLSLFADFIPLTGCDSRVQAAIDAVTAKGALVIAGAANDGANSAGYSPAGCRNVLTVTSVTQEGTRPAYANWGPAVALGAPGGEVGHGIVASSVSGPGGERSPNGTSFAAPHATGVASLLLGVRPKLSPALLRSYLTRTATAFPGGRCDPQPQRTCGAGTLNAEAALKTALASSLGK